MRAHYVSISLLTIALTLFSFNYTLNGLATKQLTQDKTIVTLQFTDKNDYDVQQFIDFLNDFSMKQQMSISRYHFLNEHTIHIYTTNLEQGSVVHLRQGDWPKLDQFVSNIKEDNDKQVGLVSFPLSMWKARYYPIDQMINVGVSNTYYLHTTDSRIKSDFVKQVSYYADVDMKEIEIYPIMFVDKTLLQVTLFTMFVLFFHLFYLIYRDRQQIYLSKLWGYSFIQTFLLVLTPIWKPFISITFILATLVSTMTFFLHQTVFWFPIVVVFFCVVFLSLIAVLVSIFIAVFLLHQSFYDHLALKGKPPYSNYQLAAILIKIGVVISLLFVVQTSFANMSLLKRNLDNMSYWQQTKDIYRINVYLADSSGNLAEQKKMNEKIKHFYELLREERNGFVMNAMLFYNNELRPDKEPLFSYERNTTGEEQIYHPSGRRITINENYLLYHPVEAVNGVDILEQLKVNANELNILVPEQYQQYERIIKSSYQDYFHSQKVRFPNIYNEDMGNPLIDTTADELDIHIIYTKSDQYYFSYNSMLGLLEDHHYIKDPIVIIMHDDFDSSTITANATTSLFFEDHSQGDAYNSIIPILQRSGAENYVNFVVSVYEEQSNRIVSLWQQLIQQIISIILLIMLSVILLIIFIWGYYKSNMLELNLKYLFGYSYWGRHKWLIWIMVLVYALSGTAILLWTKDSNIWLVILTLFIIESSVLWIFTNYFNIKNTAKITKGELL